MLKAARVVLYDDEIHLDIQDDIAIGDTFEVIRGNGPREGDYMGIATVVALDERGLPMLDMRLGGRRGDGAEEA